MFVSLAFLSRFLLGGFLAALTLAGRDLLRLGPVEPEEFDAHAVLLRRLVVLGFGFSSFWALVAALRPPLHRLGEKLGRRPALLPALVLSLASIPGLLFLSRHILSGAGVSRWPAIELLRLAGPVLLFCLWLPLCCFGFAGAHRLLEASRRWRVLAGSGLLLMSLGADHLDGTLFPGLYIDLHDALFVAAMTLGTLGFSLLLPRRGHGWPLMGGLVVVLTALALWGDQGARPAAHQRSILFNRCLQGRRVLTLWQRMGVNGPGLYEGLALDADFQAERRQVRLRLADARVELQGRLGRVPVRNVLWITLDTLRADSLSFYGYSRRHTPNMRALALRSTLFERHYAQFPITSFSFQSMFFSRYPSATPLFRRMKDMADDHDRNVTLAAALSRAGIRTISFPAIAAASLSHPHYEVLALGFDEVNPGASSRRPLDADFQARLVVRRLKETGDKRFFMWVHLMDPHEPYVLHPEVDFGSSARERYDSEVAFADRAIGTILEALTKLGLEESTAVIVNSDHGEAFGEHGTSFHGTTLYDEQVRVPAMVHVPGLEPQRVTQVTGNIDLMPTVLDLMNVDPPGPMQGQSLAGFLMDGDSSLLGPLPFAYAEIPDAIPEMSPANSNRQMIVQGRFKLLVNQRNQFVELFDMRTDPRELKNIAAREPARRDQLLAMIKSLQAESRVVNLPAGSRSEEDVVKDLRAELKGGTVPARIALLREHMMHKSSAMVQLARDILGDKEEHFLVKLALLEVASYLGAGDVLPFVRQVLTDPPVLGAAASVLDLWLSRGWPLKGSDQELVHANMQRHPQVGWRAARLLAFHGDSRAKLHLVPGLALGDRRTAFDSATALGMLEDGSGVERLRRDLAFFQHDISRACDALRALTILGDRESVPFVTRLVGDRYLHYRIKLAAADFLLKVAGDSGKAGLVYLSSGWDPDADREIHRRMVSVLGQGQADLIQETGRLVNGIDNLVGQNRSQDALDMVQKILFALPLPREAAPFFFLASELERDLGRGGRARHLLERILKSDVPAVYTRCARARLAGGTQERAVLEVLSVTPCTQGPLQAGQEVPFLVRLRHGGNTFIPGGLLPGSIGVSLSFEGAADPELPAHRAVNLPAWGLAPGDEVQLSIVAALPRTGTAYDVAARVFRRGGGRLELKGQQTARASIMLLGSGLSHLSPAGRTLTGQELVRFWHPSPAFNEAVVNPDQSVAWLGVRMDPQLVSPLLKPAAGPLRVEVEFDTETLPEPVDEVFEVFYRYEGQPRFLGHQRAGASYRLDGTRHRLSFSLPQKNGRGPVQIRLDPFGVPHLAVFHGIRLSEED